MEKVILKKFQYENIDYEFYGYENEYIFKHVPWYEEKMLIDIKNLNISGTYVDVGGNIGNHSLFFLNHCISDKVITFEPINYCFNILKLNLEKNTTKSYQLNKIAVWNEKTMLEFKLFNSFGNMGMSKVFDGVNKTIEANTLDNTLLDEKEVGLIKIDVEGGEINVLKGGINIIKKHNPLIICEANTEDERKKIDEFLSNLGYKQGKKYNATPTYFWKKEL